MGLAAEIHRIARDAAGGNGPVHLTCVRLAIGELAAVEPQLLDFAWKALTAGGPDEGALLEVDWRRARQTCATCGDVPERAPGSWLRLCPACGGALCLEGGDELDVLQVVFEKAAPPKEGARP